MEEEIAKRSGIPYYGIYAGKLRRYFSIRNVIDLFKLPLGVVEAFFLLVRLHPDHIFSKGGYVSVPVLIAAWTLRIPTTIHESDVMPGLATRIGAKFAKNICVSWERSMNLFPGKNVYLTGIPIREMAMIGSKINAKKYLHLDDDKPVLLVTGGGLGAKAINDVILEALPSLLLKWNIIHLTGKGKSDKKHKDKKGYFPFEFVHDEYADMVVLSDAIVTRAGSTALAEFESCGKNLILIPLPLSASRGDQIDNAKEFKKRYPQSTIIIDQKNLNKKSLVSALDQLKDVKAPKGGNDAVNRIISIITTR